MQAYSGFAEVYDLFMDNIPYEEWGEYIKELLGKNKVNDGLVLDLGCGTGTITEILADEGYDMIGLDSSDEMLSIAIEKREVSGHDILYLNQDMREFELYGTVRAVVSICDSLNYILDEEELLTVFKLVNNYLDIGGIFVFDMTTEAKFEEIGDSVITESRDEGTLIWENCYYEDEKVNEYNLTLFIRNEDGRYDKYEENHLQRVYSIETVKKLIDMSGLEFVAVYDAMTFEKPKEDSQRIYFVAREKMKLLQSDENQ